MSFNNGRNIALDQLPDQRIFNPLRGKAKSTRSGAPPASAAAGRPPQAGRPRPPEPPAPARAGGLFSRMAPAAQQPRANAETYESSDEEEDDDDGEDSPSEPEARRGRRTVPRGLEGAVASGPFAKVANTNQCRFQFVAAFKDVNGSLSKSSASVTVQFSEILRYADTPDSFSRLDPRRTIPIYVRVAGTSLSEDFQRVCALEVYDAAGKQMYSKWVHKHNSSEAAVATGYPLFLYQKGGQNNIFFNPPELSSDHKTYWTFTMETLEKNTSMFVNPTTGEQYVIIKKDSGCAKLMQYALSERNDIVRNPWLLENPAYQNPNDPDNIRLPIDMYNKVKAAYRKKLGEIAATSFDLSSVKVVLKPLDLAKEMWAEHSRAPQAGVAVPNVNHVWGHVALEVCAHIPAADEEKTLGGPRAGGAPALSPAQSVAQNGGESDEDL
jgi:hypothetical protein